MVSISLLLVLVLLLLLSSTEFVIPAVVERWVIPPPSMLSESIQHAHSLTQTRRERENEEESHTGPLPIHETSRVRADGTQTR